METREEKNSEKKATKPKKVSLLFLCIPVSPGKSRLIWSFPRNFATFLFKITPPWVLHMTNNLVLDSDMYLLHLLVSSDPFTVGTENCLRGLNVENCVVVSVLNCLILD